MISPTLLKREGATKMPSRQEEPEMLGTQSLPLSIAERAAAEQVWGIATAIDIYECNPATIRDAEAIRRFVVQLCDLIEMKRFGETQVVHFGEDEKVAGYSMVQLIETSLISAHFANLTNTTYLDVFSCKPYDPDVVASFAREYFGGSRVEVNVTFRR